MNKGIKLASSDYLIFLNSGDTFFDCHVIENIVQKIKNKSIDIFYSDVNLVPNSEGCNIIKYPEFLDFEFWIDRTLNHQSSLIKRSVLLELSCYSTDYILASDFNFYLRAFLIGKNFMKLPFVICNYDIEGLSTKRKEQLLKERSEILNSTLSTYIIKLWNDSKEIAAYRTFKIIRYGIELNSFYQKIKLFFRCNLN